MKSIMNKVLLIIRQNKSQTLYYSNMIHNQQETRKTPTMNKKLCHCAQEYYRRFSLGDTIVNTVLSHGPSQSNHMHAEDGSMNDVQSGVPMIRLEKSCALSV